MPDQQHQSTNHRHLKLIFFSDDEHMEQEVAYYDALLDLKKRISRTGFKYGNFT